VTTTGPNIEDHQAGAGEFLPEKLKTILPMIADCFTGMLQKVILSDFWITERQASVNPLFARLHSHDRLKHVLRGLFVKMMNSIGSDKK